MRSWGFVLIYIRFVMIIFIVGVSCLVLSVLCGIIWNPLAHGPGRARGSVSRVGRAWSGGSVGGWDCQKLQGQAAHTTPCISLLGESPRLLVGYQALLCFPRTLEQFVPPH